MRSDGFGLPLTTGVAGGYRTSDRRATGRCTSVQYSASRCLGLEVEYGQGSLNELSAALTRGYPSIIFLRTSELPYWQEDTPHAVVLVGLDGESAFLLDPAYEDETPVSVTLGDFLLAWSHFDMVYALITK